MSIDVNRSEEVIAGLLKNTFAETGLEFLRALVRFAAQAMKVSGVDAAVRRSAASLSEAKRQQKQPPVISSTEKPRA